jgi:hypothetical protein
MEISRGQRVRNPVVQKRGKFDKKKGMIVRRVEANDHLVNVTNATHDKVTSLDLYVSSTKDSEFQLAMRQRFSPSDPFMVMYF